jgi:hypothetical protein
MIEKINHLSGQVSVIRTHKKNKMNTRSESITRSKDIPRGGIINSVATAASILAYVSIRLFFQHSSNLDIV